MPRQWIVVLTVLAFVSGMGLRHLLESEAYAIVCATPDWCEDYNNCQVAKCVYNGEAYGCVSDESQYPCICCDWHSTFYDCPPYDGITDCVDVHFTGPGCGKIRCISGSCTLVLTCP